MYCYILREEIRPRVICKRISVQNVGSLKEFLENLLEFPGSLGNS